MVGYRLEKILRDKYLDSPGLIKDSQYGFVSEFFEEVTNKVDKGKYGIQRGI